MLYLGNDRNMVRDAALTMTNVVPSNAISRVDAEAKQGGGTVRVTGPYAGGADAVIDIEITDTTPDGAPFVSAPVFSGVGNGTISDITADVGAATGRVVITLEDLGTETRAAFAPFQGVTLRAKASGAAGNAITLVVDRSALVRTATAYSLREALAAGATDLVGDHWAFGPALLNPSGTLPSNAPRISIGDDPAVLRQYMEYEGGHYVYNFSPPPPRAIDAGALVYSVTGGYTITISNGVDPDEVYGPFVTLFAALDAIRADSDLIEVEGVVVNDLAPGGQGAVDVDVFTAAYCARIVRDGGAAVKRADIALQIAPDAPLEDLVIELLDAERQIWDVRGPVSGLLAQAITNVLYSAGPYQFLIPPPPIDPASTGVSMFIELDLVPRDGGSIPQLCGAQGIPGINARNGTLEFIWQPKAADPCPCDDVVVDGSPSEQCLGTEIPGGTSVSEASRVLRLQRVSTWRREFVMNNTYLYDGYVNDIAFVNRGVELYLKALKALVGGTLDNPAWQASKAYKLDQVIEPVTANGFRYAISVAGTSHTSAPTFPTVIGDTVTDGAGVEYTCIGLKPLAMWDEGFRQLQLDAKHLFAVRTTPGAGAQVWAPGDATGEIMLLPTTDNGHFYRWKSGAWPGSLGTTEPVSWPTDGSDVTVGDFVFYDAGLYGGRENSTAYAEDDVLYGVYHGPLLCIDDGTTAATLPAYDGYVVNDTFADGGVIWKIVGRVAAMVDGTATFPVPDTFYARYAAILNDVLAAAGIEGNFDKPNTGDGCWAEVTEQSGWFVYNGSDAPPYMPLQYGIWNHLSKPRLVDGETVIMSTYEGAISLPISCADSLLPGDIIRVTTSGVTGTAGGYQVGDRMTASITAAGPLAFGGGQTGNDTLTWSVFLDGERIDNYALITTAPVAYHDVAAGVGFAILQGGIKFALGDSWEYSHEGGHFRWRTNAGAWNEDVPIAETVALDDGLVANFAGGTAPSWVVPDAWQFLAEALNGVAQLRQPIGGRARWTGSTVIEIGPADGEMAALCIADHEIPAEAEIRLQGSNDGFATTPLDEVIAWAPRNIYALIDADYAEYRLLVDDDGSIFWLWMDVPLAMLLINEQIEAGKITKRFRIPRRDVRAGTGLSVRHENISEASVQAMLAMLAHAGENDDRRIGVVLNESEGNASIVSFDADALEVGDMMDFQPEDIVHRYESLTLELAAIP